MEIPFASNKHALIAKQVIEVDAELQPHAVKRELSVQDDKLIAYDYDVGTISKADRAYFTRTFHTLTVRLARLTLNGFLENVDLVVRTIEVFGDGTEQQAF